MVKSATKQAKAKDIDIQRLTKKIQRLEKLAEMTKGMLPADMMSQGGGGLGDNQSVAGGIIPEENENLESDGFAMMPYSNNKKQGDLGLNPLNYANIEDEVQMELLQAQNQRQYNVKSTTKRGAMPVGAV